MDYTAYLAFGVSFILGAVLCKLLIPVLHKFKFGQYVRKEGPQSHISKSGTPTMGGIAIVVAMLVGSVFYIGGNMDTLIVMVMTFIFAIIGFLDDTLKILKKQSEGLKAWQKMGFQVLATVALVMYVGIASDGGTQTLIPFYGMIDPGGWFYPLAIVAVLGTVNGGNFTDGLDGLACSVTAVICAYLTVASVLLETALEGSSMAMAGALLAFLIYNAYPAKVFMGDTGSLALGGFVATQALLMKMPIFLIIFAFIYMIEIISVILQVSYFKLTGGKRIFKMAPIHHHFELSGWSETRTVTVFTIVTVICCIIAYLGLKFV